jgi:hypothetical protein
MRPKYGMPSTPVHGDLPHLLLAELAYELTTNVMMIMDTFCCFYIIHLPTGMNIVYLIIILLRVYIYYYVFGGLRNPRRQFGADRYNRQLVVRIHKSLTYLLY